MRLPLFVMKPDVIAERLLLTLWVGALCAIGYIAVPLAFTFLGNNELAGNYAGKLFAIVNMLGLASGSVLIISKTLISGQKVMTMWRFWLLIFMLAGTLILISYLQPHIAALKQQMTSVALQDSQPFKLFHALSEIVYFTITLAGLALVMTQDRNN